MLPDYGGIGAVFLGEDRAWLKLIGLGCCRGGASGWLRAALEPGGGVDTWGGMEFVSIFPQALTLI